MLHLFISPGLSRLYGCKRSGIYLPLTVLADSIAVRDDAPLIANCSRFYVCCCINFPLVDFDNPMGVRDAAHLLSSRGFSRFIAYERSYTLFLFSSHCLNESSIVIISVRMSDRNTILR